MKKALRTIGRILLGLLLLLVIFLTVLFLYNRMMLDREELLRVPLGTMVEIDGHDMCIYTEGEGEHTIVFLSGSGTPSPILDFKSLYTKLSDTNRIVVIEKFGYGFSDEYDGDRDFDTILRQDREALEKAGIKGPFVLCPHSLSGLEAQLWAQNYPEEVEGIVGLDMTAVNSFDTDEPLMSDFAIGLNKAVGVIGINRPLLAMSRSDYDLDDKEFEKFIAVTCSKQNSETILREMDGVKAVNEEINSKPLPKTPTIQYISGVNKDNELWQSGHKAVVDASENGELIQLDCGHYVHYYESERIAKEMDEFIKSL